ncbi:type IV pili methyl-accepting chemotaxis transducer N-terminal domain-containing protein [Roseibium sp. RKSG952]|uniref:type IV pili methyl-accepting chemotaxis transducer N-terminal domain-containing protein n=1 Tax=Roseibium sp. RKSG952 TaxID=2529384 RepID=UPI0012BD42C5|nr:type IV pili methyl-accepting chemotaxis transducer N-terminal domain-containing protein [Roseibium sp. RKSG952]MTH97677.1 hypothetical protein [Roseibium sp. RKSG952]
MAEQFIKESTYARLINIAGRQRMLSQRIGLLVLSLMRSSAGENAAGQLQTGFLDHAVRDFGHGYEILLNGDASQDLPSARSGRINLVLNTAAPDGQTGAGLIEAFLKEAHAAAAALKAGERWPEDRLTSLTGFVLGPLLSTLQALVEALEADFADTVQAQASARSEDMAKVMQALKEIQKASRVSRMVALNAKISADRAGSYGREFGALTEELKKISADITTSSQDIIAHLDHA